MEGGREERELVTDEEPTRQRADSWVQISTNWGALISQVLSPPDSTHFGDSNGALRAGLLNVTNRGTADLWNLRIKFGLIKLATKVPSDTDSWARLLEQCNRTAIVLRLNFGTLRKI